MTAPPCILGAALLFWGWQLDMFLQALPLALAVESCNLLDKRWEMSSTDWSRLSDLCAIILLSIIAYQLFQEERQAVYMAARLAPVIFFPLILAQRLSTGGTIDLSSLSLLQRRKKRKKQPAEVDASPAYLIVTLLAAGIHTIETGAYFYGVCLLGCWASFTGRTRHYSVAVWGSLTLVVLVLGYAGQAGIQYAEKKAYAYAMQWMNLDANPLETTTAIGDIGRQKLSDRIVFRLQPEQGGTVQNLLLKEAAYNSYRAGRWYAFQSLPQKLRPVTAGTYALQQGTEPAAGLRVREKTRKGRGTLKLPGSALQVEQLHGVEVTKNALGTVVFSEASSSWLDYRVAYAPRFPQPSELTRYDLVVPETEREAITAFIDALGLRGLAPEQVLSRLRRHFDASFGYTLRYLGKGTLATPVASFLLEKKAGHCELFATATVLVLRELGIPSRYTIGYVAAEYSRLEQQYIIRHRHGHAWARVFVDGTWQDYDTTTANWLEIEEQNQSGLHYISDFFSFLSFQFARIRDNPDNHLGKVAAVLVLFLIVLVCNRIRKQKGRKTKKAVTAQLPQHKAEVLFDSAFYELEKAVTGKGFPRFPGEPALLWADRVEQAMPALLDYTLLRQAALLHYSLRFGHKAQHDRALQQLQQVAGKLQQTWEQRD